jgi:hypothetical protein
MDQPILTEQVKIGIDHQPGQREVAPSALEKSGGEIVVPSTAAWSEGISPRNEGYWAGY